jgi:hypothetical protein
MKKVITEGPVSDAQIAEWKKEYGADRVKVIEVTTVAAEEALERLAEIEVLLAKTPEKIGTKLNSAYTDLVTEKNCLLTPSLEVIKGYFRKPSVDELGIASQGNEGAPLKVSTIVYNTCLLGGHPDFETDEDVKMAALKQFKGILKGRTASLKKV